MPANKKFRVYVKERPSPVVVQASTAEFTGSGFLEMKNGSSVVAAFPVAEVQGWKLEEQAENEN